MHRSFQILYQASSRRSLNASHISKSNLNIHIAAVHANLTRDQFRVVYDAWNEQRMGERSPSKLT